MARKDAFNWAAIPPEMENALYSKTQVDVFRLLISGHSWQEVADARGTTVRQVAYLAKRIRAQLEAGGYDPYAKHKSKPPKSDQETFGKAELIKVGKDGSETVLMYWNKSRVNEDSKKTALSEFAKSLEIPAAPRTKKTKETRAKDLMNCIVIGDAHVGMYAYGKETRSRNFNSDTASAEILHAIDDLISRSPKAETGMLINVGDFIHANTMSGTTGKGTPLDTDTRHHRVMQIAAKTMAYAVDKMLAHHDKVVVVCARGNHDPDAALALQLILSAYYRLEPRVAILDTEGYYHYVQWGNWLLAVHHGDKVKAPKLVTMLARDLPVAWGESTHRMWILGHFHHAKELELDGCVVKTFGTLAPPDSWHSGHGYKSQHTMSLLTFKKQGGLHSTLIYEIPQETILPDLKL